MTLGLVIIDDNEDDLYFTRVTLELCGVAYDVTSFEVAEDALAWLQIASTPEVSLILLDINMPGMDGFEFLKAFEALPASVSGDTVIAMLSSSSDPGDRARAAQFSSVRGYFTKPIDRQVAAGLVNLIGTAGSSETL